MNSWCPTTGLQLVGQAQRFLFQIHSSRTGRRLPTYGTADSRRPGGEAVSGWIETQRARVIFPAREARSFDERQCAAMLLRFSPKFVRYLFRRPSCTL